MALSLTLPLDHFFFCFFAPVAAGACEIHMSGIDGFYLVQTLLTMFAIDVVGLERWCRRRDENGGGASEKRLGGVGLGSSAEVFLSLELHKAGEANL